MEMWYGGDSQTAMCVYHQYDRHGYEKMCTRTWGVLRKSETGSLVLK